MSDRVCSSCGKAEEPTKHLKVCAKCRAALYCSRDCQKADWKSHKKVCGKLSRSGPSSPPRLSPPKGLDQPIAKPFTCLDNGTWLHCRPEKDVYRVLIDAYRMRVEDDYVFEGEVDEDSLYANPHREPAILLRGFRRFLRKACSRRGLLPSWWSADKQSECEALALDPSQFHCLFFSVEKRNIVEYYDDPKFPMQLRMFAGDVLKRGIAGNSGAEMRALMMAAEEEGSHFTTINLSDLMSAGPS